MLVLNLLQHHFSAIVIGLFCLIMLIPVSILVVEQFCLERKQQAALDANPKEESLDEEWLLTGMLKVHYHMSSNPRSTMIVFLLVLT